MPRVVSCLGFYLGVVVARAVPAAASDPPADHIATLRQLASLRGQEYLTAAKHLAHKGPPPEQLGVHKVGMPLAERVALMAWRVRAKNPGLFEWWEGELSRYMDRVDEERRESLRSSGFRTEQEREEHWRTGIAEGRVKRMRPRLVLEGKLIPFWTEVGGTSYERGGVDAEVGIVKKWGTDAYPMLLEFMLFEPYSALLYRESKDLLASPRRSAFWFQGAASIRPKDPDLAFTFREVLGDVAVDKTRVRIIRLLALYRMVALPNESLQIRVLIECAQDSEEAVAVTACYYLAEWALNHADDRDQKTSKTMEDIVRCIRGCTEPRREKYIRDYFTERLSKIETARRGRATMPDTH